MTRAAGLASIAAGALLFAGAPAIAAIARTGVTLDFRVDAPPEIASGVYPAERTREGLTWVWTRGTFSFTWSDLDRRGPWLMTLTMAAQRADGTEPEMVAAVDGVVVRRERLPATGFVDRTVELPAAAGALGPRRTTVTFTVMPTFVPGPNDPRELGVLIDRIRLEPIGFTPGPPGPAWPLALVGAAAGALVWWLALGGPGLAIVAALAIATAAILTHGVGPFIVPRWTPAAVACATTAAIATWTLRDRGPLPRAAAAVVLIVAGVVWLRLLILLHPDMPIGDALFHAHRFQDVLAGRYYFTSVTPGDFQFPYAIALYLVALAVKPAVAMLDHMTLLRAIVVVADAAASVWLYRLIGGRAAGVIAVAAYHLLPLTFNVITTGNLTNMFGQSMAVVAFATAGLAFAHRDDRRIWIATGAVAGVAMLSHTSTFAVLTTQLLACGAWLIARGGADRVAGVRLLTSTAVAAAAATLLYYGHFLDVYRDMIGRVVAETGAATGSAGGRTPLERLAAVPEQIGAYLGWVALGLAIVGSTQLRRLEPRLFVLVASWLGIGFAWLAVGIVTPVDMRHYLAMLPALAVLIGTAMHGLWRAGVPGRAAAVIAGAWLCWRAAVSWMTALGGS